MARKLTLVALLALAAAAAAQDPQAAAAAPAVPLPSLPVLPVHVDPAAGGNAPADAAAPPADSTTTDPAATAPPTARPKPPPAKPAPGAPPRADASVTLVAEGAAWADGKLTLHNASPTAVAVSDRRPGVPSRALAASFAADVPADTVVDALLLGSSADGTAVVVPLRVSNIKYQPGIITADATLHYGDSPRPPVGSAAGDTLAHGASNLPGGGASFDLVSPALVVDATAGGGTGFPLCGAACAAAKSGVGAAFAG